MMLVVLRMDLKRAINPADPIWDHYKSFKWWLLPHAIALGPALLLGPLQFVDAFRQRFPVWHRRLGWTYICGVFVGTPIGIWIEIIKHRNKIGSLMLLIGTASFGTVLLVTTGTALVYAVRRRFQDHRRWMVRSYALAVIFLETRTVDEIPLLSKLRDWPSNLLESHGISDMWMYIAFSLLLAELILRNQSRPRRNRTAVSSRTALPTSV
jgi:hypothetical protein